MKVTPKLESDYDKVKKMDESKFITKETIKDFVAAELFIPIVEELYDNNIFTCWSGLEGDAHIRIPLDGLSKENWKIAKENCINNPNNWKIQKPPYRDLKDILPNYTLEIFVRYKDGITDVSEVVSKLLTEIRKLSYQDVQIAKPEYARYSQLPRLTLAGLYKQSEVSTFNSETKGEYMVPAESYEELSKMFLDGETPEYFYDDETDTYFRNKVLIKKSKEYREYEKSPEKRKEREINNISKRLNEEMTDEQKYKVIFDWMINYFKYDYKMLYDTQSYELMVLVE